MKLLAAAGLLAISTLSFAESKRDIYDLMYLPQAGTFFGATKAGYTWGKATLHDDTAGDIADIDISGYSLDQTVGYSITNNFFLSASMAYANTDVDFDITGASTDTFTSTGVTDPRVDARIRIMDSTHLLDILVGGSIATGDAKSANENKDGNLKNGGNVLDIGVELGQKDQASQYAVQFGIEHAFEAINKTDGVKTEENAHTAYNLRGSWLYAFSENTFLKPSAEIIITNGFNDDSGSKTEQSTQLDLGAEYQYLMSQNLLLRAGVKYTNMENSVSDGIESREDHLLTFIASANYQF